MITKKKTSADPHRLLYPTTLGSTILVTKKITTKERKPSGYIQTDLESERRNGQLPKLNSKGSPKIKPPGIAKEKQFFSPK
jgi:hypothetical protein